MPFFHLKGESFWHLKPKLGLEKFYSQVKSIKSLNKLKQLVDYADLDLDCYALACNAISNSILRTAILDTYFPETKKKLDSAPFFYEYETKIEQQILHESIIDYQKIIRELGRSLDNNQFEEERFIRSGKFKRIVPRIYGNTCAISRHNLESSINIQMIDACHIIPFSESYNDTITNGIALSPSIHRAFDRMLITINKDYIIRVSPTVVETDSPFSLRQFDGMQIHLPERIEYQPSLESLNWHNSRFIL